MAEPMTMDEKIKRINELYHKSQAEGLSAEEKDEQARLRKEYINSVKVNPVSYTHLDVYKRQAYILFILF